MRVFHLILAIYVIVLSMVPCCTEERCNDDIKTEQTANNHPRHESNDTCNSGACSPFLTCGSCTGFVSNALLICLQPYMFFVKKQNINFKFGQINNYYTKYWQPPKLMNFGIL
jgi:hypothetical protein